MEVTQLTPHIGAEVNGVQLSAINDDAFDLIYRSWLQYSVLRFRDQELSEEQLQRFSERFGPLEEIPLGRMPAEQRARIKSRFVTVISNIKIDGRPIGGLGNSEANWHSDMTYVKSPPPASILLAEEIPAQGGDTYFASQYAAFDALPADLRATIADLRIKHDAAHTSVGELRPGFTPFDDPRDAPGADHAIVQIHPETQRPCLFLGRRDWAYVLGLPLADSEALLDRLWQYAARPEFIFRQSWRVGDVVIWDNRCVLHRRDEFPANSRRLMRRCQVLSRS